MLYALVSPKAAAAVLSAALAFPGLTTATAATPDCGWTATAAQLAQQLASVNDSGIQGLRDELTRLGYVPGGAAPACGTPAAVPAIPASARVPAEALDLANWYLTLPTGRKGHPDTVQQRDLAGYTSGWFHLDRTAGGIAFTANAGGVTTAHSKYPRSELREMTGTGKASWSNTSGTHTMDLRQAVTALPTAKPEVVTAQIHDAHDDVVEIRLEGSTLIAQYDNGKTDVTLDPHYVLGAPYDLKIVAADGRIRISYNGRQLVDIAKSGSGWYFKTGAYIQSNPSKGDSADAVATVVLQRLSVQHSE